MGSSVIYHEYEKRVKFEDYDMKADTELGTFNIRCYHFDDESFVHPLHSVSFDPDCPYKIPIKALMAYEILSSSKDEKSSTGRSRSSRRPTPQYSSRGIPPTQRERSTSSVKGTSSFCYGMASSSLRKPRSWELIPPFEDLEEEEEDPEEEEEGSEEEEDSEEGIPASSSLPMNINADEDYLHFIEELEYRPEHSPLRSSQAFVPDSPREASDNLTVITFRVMISLEFGKHHCQVRVPSVPHFVSIIRDLGQRFHCCHFSSVLVPSPSLGDRCKVRPGNYVYSLVS
ncbi:hypothetical protein PIB30_046668 [Stylosanthes scabra]|uniref:Uncharacterized protein n=1 Tax=Stylosanthes scabra TaxID=79078 RepID=A0ABU6SHA1_9FABA|nr:hypothetical protein [Stylosanthes scabra]